METQYIIPFSNDLWYSTKCAPRNSNGENKNTKKTILWWSIIDFNFDGRNKLIRNWKTLTMKRTTWKISILPQWNTVFPPIQWSWLTSSRGTSSPCRIYIYMYSRLMFASKLVFRLQRPQTIVSTLSLGFSFRSAAQDRNWKRTWCQCTDSNTRVCRRTFHRSVKRTS